MKAIVSKENKIWRIILPFTMIAKRQHLSKSILGYSIDTSDVNSNSAANDVNKTGYMSFDKKSSRTKEKTRSISKINYIELTF